VLCLTNRYPLWAHYEIQADCILFETAPHTGSQNIVELLVVVFVHPDVLAGSQSTHQAVVDVLLSTTRFEDVANIIQSTADDNNLLQSDISDY